MNIAKFIRLVFCFIGEPDMVNPGLFHSQQFPLIDNAVRVAVFPNFYFVPCSIVLVKNVVLVTVEIF